MSARLLTFTVLPNNTQQPGPDSVISAPWEWWCKNYFAQHAVRHVPGYDPVDLLYRPGVTPSFDLDVARKAFNVAKNGPAIILGAAVGGKTDIHIQSIDAFGLDIEHRSEEQIVQIMDVLEPYHYVLYSTFKHGSVLAEGQPRVRFIVPLDKPIQPAIKTEFEKLWHRMNAMIGGHNDPTTKNPARLNYLPSTWHA